MFTAAIFDMDGLLIDSERALLRVWTAVAAEFGVALQPADFVRMVGLGAAESNTILRDVLGSETRVRELRQAAAERIRSEDRHSPAFPLRPGAAELIRRLHRDGIPLAVASSTRIGEVRRRLDRVGLLDAFAAVAGGDEVARTKPDPGVFLLAAERLGHDPRHCLAFEDSPHGLHAAVAAGMQVVLVPDLVVADASLRARAHAVLPSLIEADVHLSRWFAAHHCG